MSDAAGSATATAPVEDHGIDLAPMLDFVLNLLIFFIITTSFVHEPGITVDQGRGADGRPSSSTATS